MGRRKQSTRLSHYEAFTEYLDIMHQKALDILNSLSVDDKRVVEAYLERRASAEEHYWTSLKLFYHAMYIPMFIQIGSSHFETLIYIDTHAGPGLAKIGPKDDEVVLGSPLIALYWPQIIAEKVPQFRKIRSGFTRLIFIDADHNNIDVLRRLTREYSGKTLFYANDVNKQLPYVGVYDARNTLIYMFIDPYGSFDSQLSLDVLERFSRKLRVDIMLTLHTSYLARGIAGIKDPVKRSEVVETLLGSDYCKTGSTVSKRLCGPSSVDQKTVLEAYMERLRSMGFTRVETLPVHSPSGSPMYHMILATKGSGAWIDGYMDYMRTRAPTSYNALRRLWMRSIGAVKPLPGYSKPRRL